MNVLSIRRITLPSNQNYQYFALFGHQLLRKPTLKKNESQWVFDLCYLAAAAKSLQSCPTLRDPVDCSLPGSSVHGDFPGKNTGVDCHFLLQGIFPTQGSNLLLLRLLHWQAGYLLLAPPGKPKCLISIITWSLQS